MLPVQQSCYTVARKGNYWRRTKFHPYLLHPTINKTVVRFLAFLSVRKVNKTQEALKPIVKTKKDICLWLLYIAREMSKADVMQNQYHRRGFTRRFDC